MAWAIFQSAVEAKFVARKMEEAIAAFKAEAYIPPAASYYTEKVRERNIHFGLLKERSGNKEREKRE